tara:strand:+ start:2852 stop:3595 length:744 start_codon:yes stop_codon:yes gene_type:complete
MSKSIWETLSTIDCSEHIEKKGQFSYLAWTWAWAKVKEVYPRAHYELLDDTVYSDGTMEVRVRVKIGRDGFDLCEHTMWLPVLDFKNKPIANPNAFDINTARMRCLVKCLAMFGLGHYIYAGESLPAPPVASQEDYEKLLSLVHPQKSWELRDFVIAQGDKMDTLFNMAPQGKKSKFKADVRSAYAISNDFIKQWIGVVDGYIADDASSDNLTECWAELSDIEKKYCGMALSEVARSQMEEAIGEKI